MKEYKPKPIIEELAAPSASAVGIIRLFAARPYSFFLDSASCAERLGRFSFLGCDPFLVFRSKKDDIELEWPDGRVEAKKSDPFIILKEILGKYRTEPGDGGIPFVSGGVGYFAYDLKDFLEDLPDRACDDIGVPDCIAAFYDTIVIFDNLEDRCYVASSGLPEREPRRNAERAASRLAEFKNIIGGACTRASYGGRVAPPDVKSNFSRPAYLRAVERAKEYIKKGDIYQVNLSQRFSCSIDMEPLELYLRLRSSSPAPFSSYLGFGDVAIASSSPERFLLKRGSYIETRPIKGTRPRGSDVSGDALLGQELLESAKDRAEHIMIVDLERNDLGRVCSYGSVRVTESMALEKYANVFHLVSTVAGSLREGVGPIDCLMAAFPGGSITGAPKIRSMEIIDELEPVKRSVYTGAIGYIGFDGNMDMSIVIRTFLVKGRNAYFSVGGGIVADSDPEKEYEETLHKAKGMFEALGVNRVEPWALSRE